MSASLDLTHEIDEQALPGARKHFARDAQTEWVHVSAKRLARKLSS